MGGAKCICDFPDECNGLGIIHCDPGCGGDLCVCACGGEMDCPGCEMCADVDRNLDEHGEEIV